MTEHLSEQQLAHFRARTLPAIELPAADEHLAACSACRARLGEAQAINALTNFFQAEAARAHHPDYEQLAALIDQQLSAAERQQLETHLARCPACATDVTELRAFEAEMARYPAQTFAPGTAAPRVAPIPEQSVFDQLRAYWKSFFQAFSTWQWAGAAALVVVVAALWLFARQSQQEQPIIVRGGSPTPLAPAPTITPELAPAPVLLALNDAGGQITLDAQGKLSGLPALPPAWQQQVKTALGTQQIKAPAALAELAGERGNLMSGSGDEPAFKLLNPVATIINTTRPTLRWQPLPGATGYVVKVFTLDFDQVADSQTISATSWTLPRALERGQTYQWQVTALKDGQEIKAPAPPAPPAKFRVLDKRTADELARARQSAANSHLALGVLYAQAGLLEEAERELQALLAANPNSTEAQKLLRSVQAQRRAQRPSPTSTKPAQ